MTSLNVQSKDLKGHPPIEKEHIDNSQAVRNMLSQRGIVPEDLQPAEDIKKLQRKMKSEDNRIRRETKKKKR